MNESFLITNEACSCCFGAQTPLSPRRKLTSSGRDGGSGASGSGSRGPTEDAPDPPPQQKPATHGATQAMGECVGFQAQIASVIELLANSAVAEICKLVDDGYAVLRSQMDLERQRMEKENRVLRQKLREMDVKIRSYERRMKRRNLREEILHGGHFRPAEGPGPHQPLPTPPPPPSSERKSLRPPSKQDESRLLLQVKQEQADGDDCNLDLKVEVNVSSECSLSSGGEPCEELPTPVDSSLASPGGAGLSCRPWAKARGSLTLVPGGPPEAPAASRADEGHTSGPGADPGPGDGAGPSHPDEPGGLDLPWMQERVSHLGAAFAAAQLAQGSAQAAASSASFPSLGGAESLEAPPALLFTAGSQEMAPFAASFDMSAPPPAPAPPATSSSQRRSPASKEPLVCAVCGHMFPSSTTLKLHQRVHTGERPYACPHCGKGFAQPSNLRVHLLIHTGERRYRCTLCGKSFLSSSHLKRHRTVHTQEKPYSCSRCGQAFSQMCSVRRHRQQSQCGDGGAGLSSAIKP